MSDTSVVFNILAIDRASEKVLGVKNAFGLLAVGVAAGMAEMAAKTVSMAGDFQSSTERLVTSAGEIQSNVNSVRQGVLTMAGQVGFSAQTLSTALYTVESGGQHGADGLKVLKAAAEGAKTENADLTTVADAVTSVLQDYHLKASDAATVTSKLVAAVGAGKTTFQDLAGALHSVLPIASSAHVSFEDTAGALASMTVHGMSADQASENLADTIKHMVAPTQMQTKELGQLGVSSADLAGMLGKRGITGTLQYLSETIMSHMGPSGRVLLSAFNKSKDAARDANVMISSMPKHLQDLAQSYQHGSISLAQWRKTLKTLPPEQANILSQFAELQNHATGFNDVLKSGAPAAQTFQDALRRVTGDATGLNTALMLTGENTDYTNKAVKAVSSATAEAGGHVKGWAEIQQTFNQRMSEAKATVNALGVRIGTALLPSAQKLLGVTLDTVKWFEKHKAVAATLAITIGTLAAGFLLYKTYLLAAATAQKVATVATTVWTAAQWLLNIAMDANPVGILILGIALLVGAIVYLWFHSAGFRNFFIGMWNDIWGFLKGVGHWFAHDFVDFFKGAWKWIKDTGGEAADWIHDKWSGFINFFTSMPGKITRIASGMWSGIWNAFKNTINLLIRGWDSLRFGIPRIDTHIPGIGVVGGFSFGVPQIPYLAGGGTVASGGLAVVGERGPELVSLPTGATVHPSGGRPAGGSYAVKFAGNTDSAFATAFMRLVREGTIQIEAA